MPFKKGMIPINKGKEKNEWVFAKRYEIVCPSCKKEIITKRKNQVYCNQICYSKSEKLKNLSKTSKMIKDNSSKKYHKGFKHSLETINKILSHPRRYSFPRGDQNPGFNKSKKTILRIKEKRLYQKVLMADTKPEKAIQNLLKELGIEFIKHKPIIDIEHKYQCEICIEPNIIIECDGNYFHNYPFGREIDRIRTNELNEKGYKVLRLWEHEIINNLDYCKNKILEVMNEKRKINQMQTQI
jgi:very-short-patch-repair endonuclease